MECIEGSAKREVCNIVRITKEERSKSVTQTSPLVKQSKKSKLSLKQVEKKTEIYEIENRINREKSTKLKPGSLKRLIKLRNFQSS